MQLSPSTEVVALCRKAGEFNALQKSAEKILLVLFPGCSGNRKRKQNRSLSKLDEYL